MLSELLILAQLTTAQPQEKQQVPQSAYKAPVYKSNPPSSSVPTSKQFEEDEERLFETTK